MERSGFQGTLCFNLTIPNFSFQFIYLKWDLSALFPLFTHPGKIWICASFNCNLSQSCDFRLAYLVYCPGFRIFKFINTHIHTRTGDLGICALIHVIPCHYPFKILIFSWIWARPLPEWPPCWAAWRAGIFTPNAIKTLINYFYGSLSYSGSRRGKIGQKSKTSSWKTM